MVATLAVFAVPLAFGADLTDALLRAMTFMIVASPCAVVLATMPPLLSAIANAGRHGVLVKSAVVMERLGQVDAVALDKTGTLTEGTPRVTDIRPLPGSGLTEDGLLALAAAAEHPSEHPLARAVVDGRPRARPAHRRPRDGLRLRARRRGDRHRRGAARSRSAAPARLLDDARRGPARAPRAGAVAGAGGRRPHRRPGHCATACPVGVLGLADRLRPDAAATVAALTALTGTAPCCSPATTRAPPPAWPPRSASRDVRAGLLPAGQGRRRTGAGGRRAQGAGRRGRGQRRPRAGRRPHRHRHGPGRAPTSRWRPRTRSSSATNSPPSPPSSRLSRAARRLVVQNLVIAGIFITVLVVWDLVGHLPLPLGVAGHEGSTVIVGLNGLRLLREAALAWRAVGASGPVGRGPGHREVTDVGVPAVTSGSPSAGWPLPDAGRMRNGMHTDTERCVRAVQSKDARFDGWFFTAVLTTRIYCRPSCPVVPPKAENMTLLPERRGLPAGRVPGLQAVPARHQPRLAGVERSAPTSWPAPCG